MSSGENKGTRAHDLEPHLTVAEVCERLRVSRATVARLLRRGELRHCYVGRAVRIPVSAVLDYIGASQ